MTSRSILNSGWAIYLDEACTRKVEHFSAMRMEAGKKYTLYLKANEIVTKTGETGKLRADLNDSFLIFDLVEARNIVKKISILGKGTDGDAYLQYLAVKKTDGEYNAIYDFEVVGARKTDILGGVSSMNIFGNISEEADPNGTKILIENNQNMVEILDIEPGITFGIQMRLSVVNRKRFVLFSIDESIEVVYNGYLNNVRVWMKDNFSDESISFVSKYIQLEPGTFYSVDIGVVNSVLVVSVDGVDIIRERINFVLGGLYEYKRESVLLKKTGIENTSLPSDSCSAKCEKDILTAIRPSGKRRELIENGFEPSLSFEDNHQEVILNQFHGLKITEDRYSAGTRKSDDYTERQRRSNTVYESDVYKCSFEFKEDAVLDGLKLIPFIYKEDDVISYTIH